MNNEAGTKSAQPITRGILGTLQPKQAMPPITPQPVKLQPVKGNAIFGAILALSLTLAIFWACGAFLNLIDPPAHTTTLSERVADLEDRQEQDAADHDERIQNLEQQVQDAQDAGDEAQDAAAIK